MHVGVQHTWEMSNRVYQNLNALANAYGGFSQLALRVTRTGTGMATQYQIIPLQAAPQDDAQRELNAKLDYARHLCQNAGSTAKMELVRFLGEDHPELADKPLQTQLAKFIPWLENQFPGGAEEQAEPEPQEEAAPPTLADLL